MDKKILFLIFSVIIWSCAAAQTDTLEGEFKEVVVTGLKESRLKETVVNIQPLTTTEMREKGAFNISEGLSKIPGVSQLSTGLAISKPVIRGMYGNRILVLLSGLRFDNQQWQDEHGMGLSDIGIDRVELIKGPMAVLYGTDAVGGLINVIEEQRAEEGKLMLEFNTRFHSNTLGTSNDFGIKGYRNNKWWRVRLGGESHADYSDGANVRALNSRSDGVYFKGTFGIQKGKWISENNYHFSRNDFGFIMNDILDFMKPDARYTRKLNGPFHIVTLNVVSSRNKVNLKNSLLKLDAGFQSNSRMENEGGGKISLNMLLSTVLYHLEWIKPVSNNLEVILSQNTSYENNTNFGGRKIVPDAHMLEGSLGGFVKYNSGKVVVETGAGINNRWIKTLLTPLVNSPDKGNNITPFSRFRTSFNALTGVAVNPLEGLNIKVNVATGLRAPNLAELSSNGLREGTFRYEIGDMHLKNEQNLNIDLSINHSTPWFSYALSGYVSMFDNFIYITPTAEDYLGFRIYRYKQQNAIYTGADGEVEFTPQGPVKGLAFKLAGSYIYTKGKNGEYIPFTPAPKLSPGIAYQRSISNVVQGFFVRTGFDYVFAQNRTAPEEIATPRYYLMNASIGSTFVMKRLKLMVSVVGNNLLNAVYYDHLSRLKEFGINNIGRNITVNISLPITINYLKTKTKQ
ncbi:MAG: TonB-dependent receptor [Chitinophagales bacterium]